MLDSATSQTDTLLESAHRCLPVPRHVLMFGDRTQVPYLH